MGNNKYTIDTIIKHGLITETEKLEVSKTVELLLPYVWKYCPGVITATDVISLGLIALTEKGLSLEAARDRVIEVCEALSDKASVSVGDIVYEIIRRSN